MGGSNTTHVILVVKGGGSPLQPLRSTYGDISYYWTINYLTSMTSKCLDDERCSSYKYKYWYFIMRVSWSVYWNVRRPRLPTTILPIADMYIYLWPMTHNIVLCRYIVKIYDKTCHVTLPIRFAIKFHTLWYNHIHIDVCSIKKTLTDISLSRDK
jgi:hypothetical protein